MTVELRSAAVRGALPPTSLLVEPGPVRVVAVETDERPKVLSLLVGGRVRADAGEVLCDGVPDAGALRRRVALVDTPFASEPSPTVSLATAVREDLAFAGGPSGRAAVARVLDRRGLDGRDRVETVPTDDRLALLGDLAVLRDGVDTLVVTSPERHGGDPGTWFPSLERLAERGYGVLVVTDAPTARALVGSGAIPADAPPAPRPEPDGDEPDGDEPSDEEPDADESDDGTEAPA